MGERDARGKIGCGAMEWVMQHERNRMSEGSLFEPLDKATKESVAKEAPAIEFSHVIGQEKAKALLSAALRRRRVHKAYLFYGPEGTGKDALAIEFAKALNCSSPVKRPCQTCPSCRQIGSLLHPDFRFVFAAPKSIKEEEVIKHIQKKAENPYLSSTYSGTATISIERIRELKKDASLKRHHGRYQVFVISEAERMSTEAANSLLKLLEEPPEKMVIILTTARFDRLLPTIISRCQMIKFAPLHRNEIKERLMAAGMDAGEADVIARLSMGNYRKALEIKGEELHELREEALQLLKIARSGNEIKQMDYIAEQASAKDRGQIKELLHLSLLWLRDLQLLPSLTHDPGIADTLYNVDRLDELKELAQLFEGINLEKTITETENYIDLVGKNVYISLVLINFINVLAQKI